MASSSLEDLVCDTCDQRLYPLATVPNPIELKCELCKKKFIQDERSYGCTTCDYDICYRCLKDCPSSSRRASRPLDRMDADGPVRTSKSPRSAHSGQVAEEVDHHLRRPS